MPIRLTYFPFAGRAEPIRIAAFLGGVELEDVRVPGQEFMKLKGEGALPLGLLPMMQLDDGRTISQCVAMLRYVAAIGSARELYPSDPLKALVVDSALDTFNDTLSRAFVPSLRERDPEKKKQLREAFAAGPMRTCFAYVEELIGTGPFLTGEQLSIADLYVGDTLRHYSSGNLDHIDPDVIEEFPRLKRLRDAYLIHPGVAEYRAGAS